VETLQPSIAVPRTPCPFSSLAARQIASSDYLDGTGGALRFATESLIISWLSAGKLVDILAGLSTIIPSVSHNILIFAILFDEKPHSRALNILSFLSRHQD
jgi:hypothetical protein